MATVPIHRASGSGGEFRPPVETYTFKASRFSSHSLLMDAFPSDGTGLRVLDIGCGNGYLAAILAARGFEVTGLERCGGYSDLFPASVTLVEADLEHGLPAIHQEFHYILCADVLEHLRSPEALLAQIRNLLAPDGVVVASLPNSGNIWFRLNVLAGRFPQDDKGLFDRTHLRFYMWDGWVRLFASAGFSIATAVPTAIPVSPVVSAERQSSLPVRTAERVFYGLARAWKKLFAYQFVVTARTGEGSSHVR